MSDKELNHVESVFHAVLELAPDDREAYLQQACNGDKSLYAEVSSLISAFDSRDGFIEEPALNLGFKILTQSSEQSMIGKSIGPYNVISRLGKGGMGEVYLAEDTRLGRKVALKFLSQEFVGDNWAKRQLRKEAQAVAQLDHPNICTVFGFEEHDDHTFMVMQYVEGETLAHLIERKTLQPEQVLSLAQQIVAAIAHAHAHGIIHRDIKPGNIMIANSVHVRVLDFGLAKVVQRRQNVDGLVESLSNLSQSEIVQGTVAYMSPEQLRGEKLDFRSDVFSIGTVLYEMLSGTNPYFHVNKVDVISSILSTKPTSLRQLPVSVSSELDEVIQKCLEKNKEARFQSASDLLIKLQSIHSIKSRRLQIGRYINARAVAALCILLLVTAISAFVFIQLNRVRTVVVLPIRNQGGQDLEYLADGLTENITGKLSGLSNLRVKPSTLVHGYKNQDIDPVRIARDLAVDGVVIGKLSGGVELPILQVTLLSNDGSKIWEDQYSIDLERILAIEGEVARHVAAKFEFRSAEDQARILNSRDPENAEARKEYWLGKYYWRNRDNDGSLLTAIDHFNNAIRLVPSYAKAHAGLADCYAYGNTVAYGNMDTKTAMNKAERAAKNALELDETLPEAHTSLAIVNFKYYWNWQEAEAQFKRAIELKPDYFQAHYGYGSLLTMLGRREESITESKIAKDLDPFSPIAALNVCRALYFAHKFDEARPCFEKLSSDQPNYRAGQYARALLYLHDGRNEEAVAILEQIYATDRRLAGAILGYAYGVAGRTKDAERVLNDLHALKANLSPQEIALIYLGLGKMEEAIDLLQQSAEEHYAPFAYLPLDPLFPKLQSDPRFINLAQRFNLPLPSSLN
jgi:eukaryotic-like serine/threonine-protein kinase